MSLESKESDLFEKEFNFSSIRDQVMWWLIVIGWPERTYKFSLSDRTHLFFSILSLQFHITIILPTLAWILDPTLVLIKQHGNLTFLEASRLPSHELFGCYIVALICYNEYKLMYQTEKENPRLPKPGDEYVRRWISTSIFGFALANWFPHFAQYDIKISIWAMIVLAIQLLYKKINEPLFKMVLDFLQAVRIPFQK